MTPAPSCVDRVEAAVHAWFNQFWVSDAVTPWPDEEDGGLDEVYTAEALERGCATVDGTLFVFTAGRGDALTNVVVETWTGPPRRPLESEG